MKQINLFTLISMLEMPNSTLDFLKMDYEGALSKLPGFKEIVKKQRRKLAIKYHPDLANGNEDLMKKVNDAADLLLKLEVMRPQPQPQVIIIQWGGGFGYPGGYAGGTATSATNTL